MSAALRLFYRRVYVTGMEGIPRKGAAILVANHPSSLMDAAFLGVLMKRQIHYFTRADVFQHPLAAGLMNALHMLPLHNHDNGRSTLNDNEKSFEKAAAILRGGGIVVFFAEGNSHIERQLQPLRKGAFRLAFQAAQSMPVKADIAIIPVGINYSHPTRENADVMVHFANPFSLSQYKKVFESNAPAALLQLSKDCYAALFTKVLHIDHPENFRLADQCLQLNRNEYHFYTQQWLQATINRFDEEKKICSILNNWPAAASQAMRIQVNSYFEALQEQGLKDVALTTGFDFPGYKKGMIVAGFPFVVIGYMLNALPLLLAARITHSTVKRPDFFSWVFVVTATLLYLFWIILLAGCFLVLGWQWSAAIVTLTLFSGVVLPSYFNNLDRFRLYIRLKKLQRQKPGVVADLSNRRKDILSFFESAATAH